MERAIRSGDSAGRSIDDDEVCRGKPRNDDLLFTSFFAVFKDLFEVYFRGNQYYSDLGK